MPVHRSFSARITASQFLEVATAIGAHVASKLQSLGSDERTLTEELCDMFLIWSQQPIPPGPHEASVLLTFVKSTQSEEKQFGFDLLLRIIAPDGRFKEALLQAKVFDPDTLQFRHDNSAGWSKLRTQLVRMRGRAKDDMYFLLVYVPARVLDGARFLYSTWEQKFCTDKTDNANNSSFGATIIPGSDLLAANGRWKKKMKCEHKKDGHFVPAGISLATLVADMVLCSRGKWSKAKFSPEDKALFDEPGADGPRVSLTIGFNPDSLRDGWPQFLELLEAIQRSDQQ